MLSTNPMISIEGMLIAGKKDTHEIPEIKFYVESNQNFATSRFAWCLSVSLHIYLCIYIYIMYIHFIIYITYCIIYNTIYHI